MPEEVPPETPKRGWLDRLLEFGNHNKVIAAATLITLATGVPYLVMSAMSAITGGSAGTAEITAETLASFVAEARTALDARIEREGGATRTADAASRSLDLLTEEAQSGATAKERRDAAEAVRDYGAGRSERALAILKKIADRQEARGELDAAAATWCQRGYLQIFEDYREALKDYELANDLAVAPLDPLSQRERGRMLRYAGRNDDAVRAFRKGRDQARAIGDEEAEIFALTDLGFIPRTSWAQDPGFQQEQHAANLRVVELAPQVLADDPTNMDVSFALAKNGSLAGAGAQSASGGAGVANEDSPAVAQVLAAELERVRSLSDADVERVERSLAGALLEAAHAVVQEVMGEVDAARTGFLRALDLGWEVLDDEQCGIRQLTNLQPAFLMVANFCERHGELVGAERAWAGDVAVLRRSIARGNNVENPAWQGFLSFGLSRQGAALIALGEGEAGIQALHDALEIARGMGALVEEDWQAAQQELAARYQCARAVVAVDREQATAWLLEADALHAERLAGTPGALDPARMPPPFAALRAELGLPPLAAE